MRLYGLLRVLLTVVMADDLAFYAHAAASVARARSEVGAAGGSSSPAVLSSVRAARLSGTLRGPARTALRSGLTWPQEARIMCSMI